MGGGASELRLGLIKVTDMLKVCGVGGTRLWRHVFITMWNFSLGHACVHLSCEGHNALLGWWY